MSANGALLRIYSDIFNRDTRRRCTVEQAIGRFGAEAHPLTGAAVARPRRRSTQGGAAGQAGIAARDMGDQTPAARPGTAGGHGSIHGAGGHGVFRGAEGH